MTPEQKRTTRELLSSGIDWTALVSRAVAHDLTSSVAYSLMNFLPDCLPTDILNAFGVIVDEATRRNRGLFDELCRLITALEGNGIDAISLSGPAFEIQAYGGLGRRDIRKLELLVRDSDMSSSLLTLDDLGYEGEATLGRNGRAPERVLLLGRHSRTVVDIRTRLVPSTFAFDIDYPGLWNRSCSTEASSKVIRTLLPEDTLCALALRGGLGMWRDLKPVLDLSAFLASRQKLDWMSAAEHARAQGSLRALSLSAALARKYLDVAVPDVIVRGGRVERLVGRVEEYWHAAGLPPTSSQTNDSLSMDQLRLHNGLLRRTRCAVVMGLYRGPRKPDMKSSPILNACRRMGGELGRLSTSLINMGCVPSVFLVPAETRRTAAKYGSALRDARRALSRDPNDARAWRDLGDAFQGLKRYRKAIACYDNALLLVRHDPIVWRRREAALRAVGGATELSDPPSGLADSNAWAVHAERLFEAKRFAAAVEASDRALALEPNHLVADRIGIIARLCACNWQRREADEIRVAAEIRKGRLVLPPFWHRAISDSESDSLTLARLAGKPLMRPLTPLFGGERYRHHRIRVAYCSTDFRDHVVAEVMAGCFECHDRSRLEITAISLGPDDGSAMRRRMEAAFDRFIDVQARSDFAVARLLRELEIDIVVDLNSYSGNRRTGIFAHRPAPVQATFQGYAGTSGLPFFDYIIADRIVIPIEDQVHYSEKVVYLPRTYMPQDRIRPPTARPPTRTEVGLPEGGFVFASHNNDYKLGPELFDVWMRLLRTVDGSVLWLKELNPEAMVNVRQEARARGLGPERIIFAPRLPRVEDHLARLQLADLFLDTRPYNAHATACDALRVGVPVITCPGRSFASRVAASVLHAAGMPEMVVDSIAEYEALATELARTPERLARIKAKLLRNRESLFDTGRITRDLEAAYTVMRNRSQQGLAPTSFAVDREAACVP